MAFSTLTILLVISFILIIINRPSTQRKIECTVGKTYPQPKQYIIIPANLTLGNKCLATETCIVVMYFTVLKGDALATKEVSITVKVNLMDQVTKLRIKGPWAQVLISPDDTMMSSYISIQCTYTPIIRKNGGVLDLNEKFQSRSSDVYYNSCRFTLRSDELNQTARTKQSFDSRNEHYVELVYGHRDQSHKYIIDGRFKSPDTYVFENGVASYKPPLVVVGLPFTIPPTRGDPRTSLQVTTQPTTSSRQHVTLTALTEPTCLEELTKDDESTGSTISHDSTTSLTFGGFCKICERVYLLKENADNERPPQTISNPISTSQMSAGIVIDESKPEKTGTSKTDIL